MEHLYLVTSLIALVPAPALDALGRSQRWLIPALNGFVMAFVALLVFLHMLPHALHVVGASALVAAGAGFALPFLLERWSEPRSQPGVAGILILGVALHAMADGAALACAAQVGAGTLPVVVLVHRLPVALLVWWLAGGRQQPWRASMALVALAAATVVGYAFASLSTWRPDDFALVEAAVGGALLHVLRGTHGVVQQDAGASHVCTEPCHGTDKASSGRLSPIAETGGILLAGVAALVVAYDPHHPDVSINPMLDSMLRLTLISAPALVLGYLFGGLLSVVRPSAGIAWASRGSTISQSVRGTMLGLPIPVCSCGVVPVYTGLHRAGLSGGAGVAFLIATPEIGIESFLLSFPLLGLELTVARVAAAAALAIGVGAWVGASIRPAMHTAAVADAPAPQGWRDRASAVFHTGFSELLEATGPWILAGLAFAALLEPHLLSDVARSAPGPWGVVAFAAIGIPMYVCASGATPLAAAFILGGISPGAALAFLLAGPATNVTTFGLLSRLHGRRIALLFGAASLIGAVGLGIILDALWSATWAPPPLETSAESIGVLHWASLGVLLVAAGRLVVVRGPVTLIRSLFEGHHHHHHDDHGHDHHHHVHAEPTPACDHAH